MSVVYICKVLTADFKTKLDKAVEEEVMRKISEKDRASDRINFLKEFESIRVRDNFNYMWNNQEHLIKEVPKVKEYYESVGLWTPEYTELLLNSEEKGYQSQPRVMWNGEIKKINEIDEIISYRIQK